MKIFVVGGGGREHALVWKLKQSSSCDRIWCAPGNAGIAQMADTLSIPVNDHNEIISFSKKESIDLVVVGPEAPLAEGLTDACQAEGITVFGPTQKAAQIESSKIFARRLMAKYGIPTPQFESFDSPQPAKDYVRQLESKGRMCVVKADGLAAGKGAIVTSSSDEANAAIDQCMVEKAFGSAGDLVVIEERLQGPELSILAITDGDKMVILPPSQDHKPIGEGDTGLNTGGMGSYTPVPIVTDEVLVRIQQDVLQPAIKGMAAEGTPYTGVLYAGLMMCDGKPYVIEFNCRFGDPETQSVLPVVNEDLLPILYEAAKGDLKENRVITADGCAMCVVMASGGYPGTYEKGKPISGLEKVEKEPGDHVIVFHAGTTIKDDHVVTSGGRVLGVTGVGTDFNQATENAYTAVDMIQFDKAYARRDIGYRVRR